MLDKSLTMLFTCTQAVAQSQRCETHDEHAEGAARGVLQERQDDVADGPGASSYVFCFVCRRALERL